MGSVVQPSNCPCPAVLPPLNPSLLLTRVGPCRPGGGLVLGVCLLLRQLPRHKRLDLLLNRACGEWAVQQGDL